MSNSPHTNRLAREKSPYLQQHRHNPVDWFPWGEEAFEKARAEDKPIFLSIGYSTCHWCHVMERESFEDEKVAEILNRHFVSIKVDREERPDVDQIYMAFVQATAGQGGWPLNCFLLPDLKPFYGGTYFAPDNRYGRPAFVTVLQQILALWTDRREAVRSSATQIHERLGSALAHEPAQDLVLNDQVLRRAGRELKKGYDSAYGGFGRAPKFPQPAHPSFLLRYGRRFNDKEAIAMALHTCERMAAGGICDQLGGGFSRYSVDDRWLVPHFEKMLYDNAQLAQLYLDAFLISAEDRFAEVARDILKYVLRDMTHPEGGFYSAEDADSEGKEGKFYCWTKAELENLLPPEQFSVAVKYYGITDEGNFTDHSDPSPLSGLNVLSVANPVLSKDDQPRLQSARRRLLAARSQRVRPHLDDKILASWNGLMLGSMARAAVILDDETYRVAAEKNLAFLLGRLWDPGTNTLFHRWREGEHDSAQLVQDYAFLLSGVLDLYQITLKPEHLETAVALGEAMIARFYDSEAGGFWQSQSGSADLILSVKDDYDGALPSGNSAAALGLLKLAAITERPDFRTPAEKTLRLFADHLHNQPQAVPCLLQTLDFWLQPPRRVVLAGPSNAPERWQLVKTAHSMYQPNCVVMGTAGPVDPFARNLAPQHGHPTAYVCHGNACQAPVRDCERLGALLRG